MNYILIPNNEICVFEHVCRCNTNVLKKKLAKTSRGFDTFRTFKINFNDEKWWNRGRDLRQCREFVTATRDQSAVPRTCRGKKQGSRCRTCENGVRAKSENWNCDAETVKRWPERRVGVGRKIGNVRTAYVFIFKDFGLAYVSSARCSGLAHQAHADTCHNSGSRSWSG